MGYVSVPDFGVLGDGVVYKHTKPQTADTLLRRVVRRQSGPISDRAVKPVFRRGETHIYADGN